MSICRYLDLPFEGEDRLITGIGTLADAGPDQLSFFHNATAFSYALILLNACA